MHYFVICERYIFKYYYYVHIFQFEFIIFSNNI